ncbi:hypothetical protein [Shewanella denitrificans]|uniref:hypothetical protein n=1 Tax=Shewanella denitrificans TaxID=192073 RepID=UPI0018DDFC03|nr:hypothetical protein [Shewanella denitrificans]
MLLTNLAFAHGDEALEVIDLRPVKVNFHLKALATDWFTPQGDTQGKRKSITFSKAYLASFSLNLVPCLVQQKPLLTNIDAGFFHAIFPKAYANHGVRFDMPTQIPLMLGQDLSQDSDQFVGEFMLPIGRYCEINYTMAHITSTAQQPAMTPYSLYLAGEYHQSSTTNERHHLDHKQAIEISARYAYGQNVPVDFEVTATTKYTHDANLTITLAPEAAFTAALSANNLAKAEHLIARGLLLAIPKQLKASYTEAPKTQ